MQVKECPDSGWGFPLTADKAAATKGMRIKMGSCVCAGAMLQCSFGVAPSPLIVLPASQVLTENLPMATIMDHKPFVNIMPFGMCSSVANPAVGAATAAALGVLTPMPCIPNVAAPWMPGSSTVLMGGTPALTCSSTCMCMWGGAISVTVSGQATVQIP